MSIFESLTKLIGALASVAWPAVTIFALHKFQTSIREFLGRVTKLGPGPQTELSDTAADTPRRGARTEGAPSEGLSSEYKTHGALNTTSGGVKNSNLPAAAPVMPKKTGNLYWMAHDIMATVCILLRGGARDDIVHGLRQSLHHATSLDLCGTGGGKLLKRLVDRAESSTSAEWNDERRKADVDDLLSIRSEFGGYAERDQPDYRPRP